MGGDGDTLDPLRGGGVGGGDNDNKYVNVKLNSPHPWMGVPAIWTLVRRCRSMFISSSKFLIY